MPRNPHSVPGLPTRKQVLDLWPGQPFCSITKRAGNRFQLIL